MLACMYLLITCSKKNKEYVNRVEGRITDYFTGAPVSSHSTVALEIYDRRYDKMKGTPVLVMRETLGPGGQFAFNFESRINADGSFFFEETPDIHGFRYMVFTENSHNGYFTLQRENTINATAFFRALNNRLFSLTPDWIDSVVIKNLNSKLPAKNVLFNHNVNGKSFQLQLIPGVPNYIETTIYKSGSSPVQRLDTFNVSPGQLITDTIQL